jgi:hypothetical protein
VRIFGKTEAEIDRIVAARMADPTLVVPSPINGRITARSAAPGLLVQPGSTPPPYVVADINTMWMLANVMETDSPAFRVGQQVKVRLSAFPDRVFDGKITTIGASVDPNTRRVLVRSEINDPQHELRSGMFGNFEPLVTSGCQIRASIRASTCQARRTKSKGVNRSAAQLRQLSALISPNQPIFSTASVNRDWCGPSTAPSMLPLPGDLN